MNTVSPQDIGANIQAFLRNARIQPGSELRIQQSFDVAATSPPNTCDAVEAHVADMLTREGYGYDVTVVLRGLKGAQYVLVTLHPTT